MTVQTYCTAVHINDVLSDNGVRFRADDDQSGAVAASGTESTAVSNAIERSATRMNMALQHTAYTLSALASNEWCKWCNAILAAVQLCRRRGNQVPQSLLQEEQYYLETLGLLQRGVLGDIPGTHPSFETMPTVTNYTPEPWRAGMPVRRREVTSTGSRPPGTVKSWPSYPLGVASDWSI